MYIHWVEDIQIKIGSSAPTSELSPALALSGTRLYLAYAGTNGYIYWAWTDAKSGNLGLWQGNEKVTWNQAYELETGSTPALVFFNGLLVMISNDGPFGDVRVSYFDGNQWNGYVLPLRQDGLEFGPLSAFVDSRGQLHLFVSTFNPSSSIHLVCTGAIAELSSWANVGTTQGELTVSLGELDGVLYRLGTTEFGKVPFYAIYAFDPTTGYFQTQESQTGQVEVADGSPSLQYANIFFADGYAYLMYISPGDVTLYQAVIKEGFVNGNKLLNPSNPVQIGFGSTGTIIKSNSLPSPVISFWAGASAPVVYNYDLFMAHKGNDNNNLYFSYGYFPLSETKKGG
jgi:hypothetical protein